MVNLHSKSFVVFAFACSVVAATEASTCAADGRQECQARGAQMLQKKAHKSEINGSQLITGDEPLPVVAAVQVSTEETSDLDGSLQRKTAPALENLGGSAHTDGKLSACQGDCDSDSHCASGLKCMERNGKETVPGCTSGGSGDVSGYDFCYEPVLENLGGSAHTTGTLSVCQGDCDSDSHCASGLKCMERNGMERVPGCTSGGSGDASGYDFCYAGPRLLNLGGSAHTLGPLSACMGDCDSDSHCAPGLTCMERNGQETVPGCTSGGSGDVSDYDFCYAAAVSGKCTGNTGGTGDVDCSGVTGKTANKGSSVAGTDADACCEAPGNMCGRPDSDILKILKPPAEVQQFLSFAFGVSWTIGKIDSYKEIDARNRPGHGTCENLPLNPDREFVLLHMTTPDLSMLLTGGAADTKNADAANQGTLQRQNAKSLQKSRKEQFTDAMPALPLPLCIAIRPCGADGDTYLTQWDFGFYTDEGITVFSYPSPVDGPMQLKLKGLAFSSAGHLIPPALDNPPLFGFAGSDTATETTNAHWWIYGTFVIPIQWGQKKIADFELDGKFSAYVDVNGNSDLADIILGLADGGSPASITKFLVSSTYRFQLCGSLQASINLNLAEIFGGATSFMADMKIGLGGASILIDAQGSLTGESHLSFYFTGQRKIDLLPLLSNTQFLEKIMPNLDLSVTSGVFITVRSTGKIDFGFHFQMSMRLDCGIFDEVASVFPVLGDICGKTHDFGVSLVVRKNRLSRTETCLRLGTTDYCLNQLPSCPPGQQEGERCSANSDCKKDGEENSYSPETKGYCKSQDNVLRTSVLCSGKCVKLANAGESCSAVTTNTWPVLHSAEDEFCRTGKCLCSTCAESNGKLRDGKHCATDANCNSGFCNKGGLAGTVTSQGCQGRCTAKKPIGGTCFYDAECLNNRCSEGCRDLFNCVSGGSCVQCREDDSHCGGNQYCQDYNCYDKVADGQNVGRRRHRSSKCLTNKIICGNCGKKQNDGNECSASSDCDSNECNTKQYGTPIVGCNGNCGARRRRRTRRRRSDRRRWR